MSNLVGRRPVLIFAMTLTVAGTLWCGEAKSFDSLLGARIVQGLGMGPADSIAANVVGEMFFVHERGRAMVSFPFLFSSISPFHSLFTVWSIVPVRSTFQEEEEKTDTIFFPPHRPFIPSSSREAPSSVASQEATSRATSDTVTSSGSVSLSWASSCWPRFSLCRKPASTVKHNSSETKSPRATSPPHHMPTARRKRRNPTSTPGNVLPLTP